MAPKRKPKNKPDLDAKTSDACAEVKRWVHAFLHGWCHKPVRETTTFKSLNLDVNDDNIEFIESGFTAAIKDHPAWKGATVREVEIEKAMAGKVSALSNLLCSKI